MKRRILVIALLFLFTVKAFNQGAFRAGEKVHYIITYGFLNGGVTSLELGEDTLNGKKVYHSKLIARTTGIPDAIYKVLDIYESYIDPATLLPLKSVRNIHEGRYRRYNEVLFDHKTRADSAILTSDLSGVHITQQGIHDIISCFYFFRNKILPSKKLQKGEMITIMTWFTDELYPIRLRYIETEEIKTKAGRMMAHKFMPVTEKGRLFQNEDDVTFWLSADKNYLPVKIRFNIFVGSFMVELDRYEGLAYPLEIKNK